MTLDEIIRRVRPAALLRLLWLLGLFLVLHTVRRRVLALAKRLTAAMATVEGRAADRLADSTGVAW
jgi:hypothetical protein